MSRIFLEAHKNFPSELRQYDFSLFQKSLENPRAQFHILRHKDHVVGYMRLEEIGNGNLYAGSLNIDDNARGTALGAALQIAVMRDGAGATRTIEADVWAKNPQIPFYFKLGFEKSGNEYLDDIGVPHIHIVKPPTEKLTKRS